MKRVIVFGGGFAGLSTSVYLAENNFEVTLLEASPKLGGRAYSLLNDSQNDIFDNGQHILMGCYEETIAFLKKINSLDKLEIQKSLSIPFVKRGGSIHRLDSKKYFYPLNLLYGIMNYKALSVKERLKVIDFFLDLLCCYSCDLKDKTVSEWLKCKNQSDNSIKAFWEILVVGAFNTTVEKASAEIFAEILKRIFLTGNNSAAILLPKAGLTQLYIEDSIKFITNRKAKINLSEKVIKIILEGNKITGIVTDRNTYNEFDFVISAVPAYALEKIDFLSNQKIEFPGLEYSPIVNVHLWLKENPFNEKFYGLIDSKIHWVFNHGKHISLTASSADILTKMENEKIVDEFISELERYFPIFHREIILDSKFIKEKRATFVPDIVSNELRKNFFLSFENLFFAGDWINTGLPSTIESAVLSGRLAAGNVITSLKKLI
ncbi:MAG: hydroxysqualene dehydroxylase HpnE [Ignavibacteriales bacterium]|nr:hydroxysqualene dehydroxylase HpnE [Ignavibacteriales bacterium]